MKKLISILGAMLLVLGAATAVIALQADLTTVAAVMQIDEAVYRSYNPATAAGSGTFDAFVRVSSNQGTVQGYNTDGRPLEFQENSSPSFTRSYRLSNIPAVTDLDYPGDFREFQLDINQLKGTLLTLDEVEIYLTTDPNQLRYPFTGTAEKVYELDKVGDEPTGDNWILLNYDLAAGSGKRDMILRVPNANFLASNLGSGPECAYQGPPPAGAACTTYVVLFSRFGGDAAAPNNDGFEEWGVEIYEPTAVTLSEVAATPSWRLPMVILVGLGIVTGLMVGLTRRRHPLDPSRSR